MRVAEMRYAVILEPAEPDEGGFNVIIPALPEAHTQGETVEECLRNAREVAELCIGYRREHNIDVPSSDADGTRLETLSVTIPTA